MGDSLLPEPMISAAKIMAQSAADQANYIHENIHLQQKTQSTV